MSTPDDRPLYRIRAVAKRTGVSPHNLRAWQRRHGVPSPARTESAYRLHSEADIAIVERMRDFVASGVALFDLLTPPDEKDCNPQGRETFYAYDATGIMFAFGYCQSARHRAELWLAQQRSLRPAATWRGEPLDGLGTQRWWQLAEDVAAQLIDVEDEATDEAATLLRELIGQPGSLGSELLGVLLRGARARALHDCVRLIRRYTRQPERT